jgi:hypothetical protein
VQLAKFMASEPSCRLLVDHLGVQSTDSANGRFAGSVASSLYVVFGLTQRCASPYAARNRATCTRAKPRGGDADESPYLGTSFPVNHHLIGNYSRRSTWLWKASQTKALSTH